jgi:hypothetical protein
MPLVSISRTAILALSIAMITSVSARSDNPVRVSGYFCGAKHEQIAFLRRESAGDSEEIAANAVNKVVGKQTCAYFMPAHAIPVRDESVTSGGVVYKVQSFVFLPEKVERWTGSAFGAVQTTGALRDL